MAWARPARRVARAAFTGERVGGLLELCHRGPRRSLEVVLAGKVVCCELIDQSAARRLSRYLSRTVWSRQTAGSTSLAAVTSTVAAVRSLT